MKNYVTKNVVLEKPDVRAVKQVMQVRGLNETNGFSAALRIIIREWIEQKKAQKETASQP